MTMEILGPGMGQAQQCGRVKPVNMIFSGKNIVMINRQRWTISILFILHGNLEKFKGK
jgi:hypothetical protein